MIFRKLKQKLRRNEPVFILPQPRNFERSEIEKIYARVFSTADGQKVLAHLQSLTFARAYGPEASAEQIRYSEGQRALVATILRLTAGNKLI
jgi:hypothetical protein